MMDSYDIIYGYVRCILGRRFRLENLGEVDKNEAYSVAWNSAGLTWLRWRSPPF